MWTRANRLRFYLPELFRNIRGEKVKVTKAKNQRKARALFPLPVTVTVWPGLQVAAVSGLVLRPRGHCPS